MQRIIREGQDATAQITLRWAVVLLFVLLAVASQFGLDVVLGAMLAGMVLRVWTRRLNIDTESLEHKFDAVGYGIFIPIFFISSGMTLDLKAISQDPLRCSVLSCCCWSSAACPRCWSTGTTCRPGSGPR